MGELTTYTLASSITCNKVLEEHPDYKVFWRSGYAYRGASEVRVDNQIDFSKKLLNYLDWAAAIDITVDHEKKEIHFNGFSENDLY